MDCSRRLEAVIVKPGNRLCAECNAKNPRWVSISIGVFVCMRCCGVHRKLGTHISKMKSVTLDRWTPEMLRVIEPLDNLILNEYWEKEQTGAKPTESASAQAVESYIRAKYERRCWVDRSLPDPASRVIAGNFGPKQERPEQPKASLVQPSVQPPVQVSGALVDLLEDAPPVHTHSHSAPPVPHSPISSDDIWSISFKPEQTAHPPVSFQSVQFAPVPPPQPDANSIRQDNIAQIMAKFHSVQPPASQGFQPLGAIAAQSMMQQGYPYYGGSKWPTF